MYRVLYVQCTSIFNLVHNPLYLMYTILQFCTFDVHTFSNNVHYFVRSMYKIYKLRIFSIYIIFQRMYIIMYIQCTSSQFCTFSQIFNCVYSMHTILYIQRIQFFNFIHLIYIVFQIIHIILYIQRT